MQLRNLCPITIIMKQGISRKEMGPVSNIFISEHHDCYCLLKFIFIKYYSKVVVLDNVWFIHITCKILEGFAATGCIYIYENRFRLVLE